MHIIFFSTNMDMVDELKQRANVIAEYISCDDINSLEKSLQKKPSSIVIIDYDSVATELNKMISSNSLPQNTIVLERTPEIATGKMLISHKVKAYGNTRMLQIHYLQMLQTVNDGKVWTYPELTVSLVNHSDKRLLSDDAQNLIKNRLTSKELEVVDLILEGLTNDAIASSLEITARTVKAHVSSIFSKLHVNDRVSLILLLR
jgi:DNA-binding NarL/FixJ family response regulator